MPKEVAIFSQMRPPVAAEDGNSPLRGKNAQRVYEFASGMRDQTGFKVTNAYVVNNFTDDGKLADTNWNNRHHITPASYNGANHNFFKVRNTAPLINFRIS
jgi:hypothetical protein